MPNDAAFFALHIAAEGVVTTNDQNTENEENAS